MTIRPIMVENTPSPVEDDTPAPDVEEARVNIVPAEDVQPSSSQISPSTSVRSQGSKVSSLRAAFEHGGASNGTRPRPLSADARTLAPDGRSSSLDADLVRLKDALARAQADRETDRQQLEQRTSEIERYRAEVEQRTAEIERQRIEIEQRTTQSERHVADVEQQETMVAQYKAEVDALKAQIQELESTHGSQQEDIEVERQQLHELLHETRALAQKNEAESTALRSQLAELKKSIATNTRIESHEMTDSEFQNELGTLCYQLQDWVINRFRKTKIEGSAEELVSRAIDQDADPARQILQPVLGRWDPSAKMLIMQSVIVTLLMPIFEDVLPIGLPSNAQWSQHVRGALQELQGTLPTQAYHRWRATTLDIIIHSDTISSHVEEAVNKLVAELCTTVDKISISETNETQTDSLRTFVKRVVTISHRLKSQRALYDVRLPQPGTMFNADSMEDLADDYDGPGERAILCALFPAVLKLSDGNQHYIVFKARVT